LIRGSVGFLITQFGGVDSMVDQEDALEPVENQ
jgi:hypothetical protein